MSISKERLAAIREELQGLIEDGLLNPETVVDRARNPNSSLHDHFTWDDTEAAAAFRIQEARALIKNVEGAGMHRPEEFADVLSHERRSGQECLRPGQIRPLD